MSSNPTRTFITRKVTLADGKELRTGQAIRVVHKGYHHLGIVAFIDISGKEAGDQPTVRALVLDVLSHTVNAGIKPNPAVIQVGSGLRHISDPNPRGLRFARDESDEEVNWLLDWSAEHGRTGGTGDPSQHPDPAKIPWKAWVPGEGKPGGTGETGGGGTVVEPVEHPGKDTGEGGATFHAADNAPADHNISRQEKEVWKQKTGEDIKKGEYTNPQDVKKS